MKDPLVGAITTWTEILTYMFEEQVQTLIIMKMKSISQEDGRGNDMAAGIPLVEGLGMLLASTGNLIL